MNIQRTSSTPAGTFSPLCKAEEKLDESKNKISNCVIELLKLSVSDESNRESSDCLSCPTNTLPKKEEAVEIQFKTPDGSQEFVVFPNGELARLGKPNEVLAELRELEEYPPVIKAEANADTLIFLTRGCITCIPYDITSVNDKKTYLIALPSEYLVDFVCEGNILHVVSNDRQGIPQISHIDLSHENAKGVTYPINEEAAEISGITIAEDGKLKVTLK